MKQILIIIIACITLASCSTSKNYQNSRDRVERRMQKTGFKPYAKKASRGYLGQTESFVGYGKYKAPRRKGVDL